MEQELLSIHRGYNASAGDSLRVIVAITGERKADIVKQIFDNPEAKLPAQELLGYKHIDFF